MYWSKIAHHWGQGQRAPHLCSHPLDLLQDVFGLELGEPHDGAAGLDGFDDFGACVASEGEAGGGGVDLHGPPQRLLRACCHAAHHSSNTEVRK